MYANDLILITQASRKIAHNIKLYFSIYERLSWQCANNSKSKIFFLDRFNKRLGRSICNILNFKSSSFPFTYLGILISHKRMFISHFNAMVERFERVTSNWRHSHIPSAGKSTLINSSIISIPLYYLFVYIIPGTMLDRIFKTVRKFFWSKGGDRKGICAVNWDLPSEILSFLKFCW